MDLVFSEFVRKPFVVQAIEVTEDNIAELAKYIGDLRSKDDGTPFVLVDRRLVPNVYRVFPGYFMTRLGEHIRCYNRKLFFDQFMPSNPETAAWVEYVNTPAAT